jgi:hypothetical protein
MGTDHKAPRYVVFSTPLLLRPECLPHRSILENTQPQREKPSFRPREKRKIVVLYIFNFIFLDS